MYLSKLDAFGGYIMACIGKVEHAPECSVGVWLGYLKEREIRRIGGWKGKFVNRRNDTRVRDRPFEIPGCLAANDARGRVTGMAWIGSGSFALVLTGREEFSNTEVALGRGGQEIVLGVEVSVEIRVQNVRRLAVWGDDQGWEVVRHWRVRGRGIDSVYGSHLRVVFRRTSAVLAVDDDADYY